MKINEPFWAAFNKDGHLGGNPEGYFISNTKEGVLWEIDCWSKVIGKAARDFIIIEVKMAPIEEAGK